MRHAKLADMVKGWFVGNFDPTLARTNDCEVAVKHYRAGDHEDTHHHRIATEITVIVAGEVEMCGRTWGAGDIVVIQPGEATSFTALTDATNVVVKLPGASNDKYMGEMPGAVQATAAEPAIEPPANSAEPLTAVEIDDVTADGESWRVEGPRYNGMPLCDRTGAPLPADLRLGRIPVRLLTIQGDLAILELENESGECEAWIFDRDLRLVAQSLSADAASGDHVDPGGPEAQIVASAFGDYFRTLARDVAAAGSHPAMREFLKFDIETRRGLLALAWSAVEPPQKRAPLPPDQLREFDARLDSLWSLNWLEVTRTALETGRLSVPALTHDGEAFNAIVIHTEPYRAIVQVQDTPDGPSWSAMIDVFTLQHLFYNEAVWAVLFPEEWTFAPRRAHEPAFVHKWLGEALDNLVRLGEQATEWAAGPRQMAIVGRDPHLQHMGHQVWNTNSTLLRAVEAAQRRSVSPPDFWDISAGYGLEIYGPIEDFFPELQGRVRRTASDVKTAFVEAAREGRTLLFDVFHEMPTRLRARMRGVIAADPDIQSVYRGPSADIVRDDSSRLPVFVFGLRVTNRTPPTLLDFYVELATRLAEKGPYIAVLDGMTMGPRGIVFKTFGAPMSPGDILKAELEFGDAFISRVAHLPITVVKSIGMPIRENLFWLGFADAFVCPHGTGLAKTRWIHNTPGLTLTSAQNVLFGTTFRVYEAYGGVEDPTEILYTLPSEVRDLLPPDQAYDQNGRMVHSWYLGFVHHSFELTDIPSLLGRISDQFDRSLASRPRPSEVWNAMLKAAGQETAQ